MASTEDRELFAGVRRVPATASARAADKKGWERAQQRASRKRARTSGPPGSAAEVPTGHKRSRMDSLSPMPPGLGFLSAPDSSSTTVGPQTARVSSLGTGPLDPLGAFPDELQPDQQGIVGPAVEFHACLHGGHHVKHAGFREPRQLIEDAFQQKQQAYHQRYERRRKLAFSYLMSRRRELREERRAQRKARCTVQELQGINMEYLHKYTGSVVTTSSGSVSSASSASSIGEEEAGEAEEAGETGSVADTVRTSESVPSSALPDGSEGSCSRSYKSSEAGEKDAEDSESEREQEREREETRADRAYVERLLTKYEDLLRNYEYCFLCNASDDDVNFSADTQEGWRRIEALVNSLGSRDSTTVYAGIQSIYNTKLRPSFVRKTGDIYTMSLLMGSAALDWPIEAIKTHFENHTLNMRIERWHDYLMTRGLMRQAFAVGFLTRGPDGTTTLNTEAMRLAKDMLKHREDMRRALEQTRRADKQAGRNRVLVSRTGGFGAASHSQAAHKSRRTRQIR